MKKAITAESANNAVRYVESLLGHREFIKVTQPDARMRTLTASAVTDYDATVLQLDKVLKRINDGLHRDYFLSSMLTYDQSIENDPEQLAYCAVYWINNTEHLILTLNKETGARCIHLIDERA